MRAIVRTTSIAAALAALGSCLGPDADPASPGAGATSPGEPPPPYVPLPLPDGSAPRRAIHHVLGTGQSLAVGALGSPPLSTTQPFSNRMFAGGAIAAASGLGSFVPLVEGTGTGVETMSSGFANLISGLALAAGTTHDLLVSVHAVGGAPYRALAKGTAPYALGLEQVASARRIAMSLGLDYDVTALTSAHGAADHTGGNTRYADDMMQWQRDYETDVQAITGQRTPIPLFHTQYSSFTLYDPTSAIPSAQLRAHVESKGKVVLVGPRYPFLYGPDGVHLTNEGYRQMGEYYAKAYRRVVVEGGTWEPVRPKTIVRSGAVVTIRFHVPAPPLVLDTTRATDPGSYGFEWADDGPATPTITSVAVTAADVVDITLSAIPTGMNRRIRYAFTGTKGAGGGLRTGPRGNLRDSDATPSRHGYDLFDWCVHFDEPAP